MAKNHTVLLVIFPGQGHMNPSLEFAKRLIHEGINVNLVTAYSIINRISKTTSPPKGLTFTGFSDGFDDRCKHKLSMNIVDRIVDDVKYHGSKAVEQVIKSSIEKGQPFSHVIYTPFLSWVGHVANALDVPSTLLMIQPATMIDIYHYYFNGYGNAMTRSENDADWVIDLPGLPRLVSHDLPSFVLASNTYNFAIPSWKDHFDLLDIGKNQKVLVNTFDELEFEAVRAVKKLNLVPIGPLVKDPQGACFGVDMYDKSQGYIEWLNSKGEGEVIYISFGSYSELPQRQMEEIAKGLIDSQRPFLWVVRGSEKNDINDVINIDELQKHGKIVGWCSQVEVLSHPSVGCFVTHCGWNSCLETLVCGVPVVGFPLWLDQGTNAKLMEDVWEVGVRVEKNGEGIVDMIEIKRCLDVVMGNGEKGLKVRKNIQTFKVLSKKAVNEGGSSDLNFKNFVNDIIGF